MASDLWEKFENAHGVLDTASSWRSVALMAMERGATLPPEPQWKPGQYVMLRLLWRGPAGERILAKRTDDGEWDVLGGDRPFTDDEVTDVEPVVVLTAEDVREFVDAAVGRVTRLTNGGSYEAQLVGEAVVDEFAERGVDVR